MTEVQIFTWAVNGLLLIVGFFMRQTLTEVKEQLKEQKKELDYVKDHYFKRADFTDFKEELFSRLDRDHAQILREIANK
jgi:hypothetical protein